MTSDEWQLSITRLISREVRRHRDRQNLSAQQLADRTKELGAEVPRSVIANLEAGRRDTVTVSELLALAGALGVPPIELVCPVGFDKDSEILPGLRANPDTRARWFNGDLRLSTLTKGTLRLPRPGEETNIALHAAHTDAVNEWVAHMAAAVNAETDASANPGDDAKRKNAESLAMISEMSRRRAVSSLRHIRADMRARGMTILPPLPVALDADDDGLQPIQINQPAAD